MSGARGRSCPEKSAARHPAGWATIARQARACNRDLHSLPAHPSCSRPHSSPALRCQMRPWHVSASLKAGSCFQWQRLSTLQHENAAPSNRRHAARSLVQPGTCWRLKAAQDKRLPRQLQRQLLRSSRGQQDKLLWLEPSDNELVICASRLLQQCVRPGHSVVRTRTFTEGALSQGSQVLCAAAEFP